MIKLQAWIKEKILLKAYIKAYIPSSETTPISIHLNENIFYKLLRHERNFW